METTLHTQLKRYGMLCVGLLIMSFGIACSIKAELGTSPVSSLPFVLSQFTDVYKRQPARRSVFQGTTATVPRRW